MGELEACPRCGTRWPHLIRTRFNRQLFYRHYVKCWNCYLMILPIIGKHRAVKSWNKLARGKRGYRKTGTMEQLLYIMEYFLKKRWGWVSGEQKSGKDV